jgi:DNA helicase-2/ATP-dependent DNA helicase PcrA
MSAPEARFNVLSFPDSKPGINTFGLSPAQFNAVIGTKDIFLQACPGSGKTKAVAARVAWATSENKRLALLSYSNIGADEMAYAIASDHNIHLSEENFNGTIDSFLNRYLLRPFGHLVTNSKVSMQIDMEGVKDFSVGGHVLGDYEFTESGRIRHSKGRRTSDSILQTVRRAKVAAARSGIVDYNTSLYACLRVMRAYPKIAAALAARFDEIIVDEAQDTNEMQLQCFRQLRTGGVKSIVLVGDYDQTIYEFGGSTPEGCEKFASDVGLETKRLLENYRSSQILCNMTSHFRGTGAPDIAVGRHAGLRIRPRIVLYGPGTESSLTESFRTAIKASAIHAGSSAILTRAGTLADSIRGGVQPKTVSPLTELIQSKSTAGLTLFAYRTLERDLISRAWGRGTGLPIDRLLVRTQINSVLNSLPEFRGCLAVWASTAYELMDRAARDLSPAIPLGYRPPQIPAYWNKVQVNQWAKPATDGLEISVGTIHSAKGRSIDAVMLVAAPQTQSGRASNAQAWTSAIGVARPSVTEELRLGYVGLTRARQLAIVALPEATESSTIEKFLLAGFAR